MVIGTARSSATQNLAPGDGTYELNGLPYRIRRGDPLPEGAAFAPSADAAVPTGPQSPDAKQASAALGEGYAAALKAAGFALFKESEMILGEAIEAEGLSDEAQGEQIARLLEAAGIELKRKKAKAGDSGPTGAGGVGGPAESTQSPGPGEAS